MNDEYNPDGGCKPPSAVLLNYINRKKHVDYRNFRSW